MTAVLGPLLGALGDQAGMKKRFLGLFLGLGVAGTAALFLVRRGDWLLAAGAFVVAAREAEEEVVSRSP